MEAEKNFLLFHLSALFLQCCSVRTQFHSYQQLRIPVNGYIKLIQNIILCKKFISRRLGIFGQNSDNKEY